MKWVESDCIMGGWGDGGGDRGAHTQGTGVHV